MHCSFRRQVMMLLKMLLTFLHMLNLQNTSLCSTTFTHMDYTYCLIKVLEICVLVVTLLGIFVLLLYCIIYVYLLFVLSVLV